MAGIYIHIPFCRKACIYCDFHFSTQLNYKSDFVKALLKEIELRKDYAGGEEIRTIYFGGGTPSVLDEKELQLILNSVRKFHSVHSDAEVTLEANPDDLTREKLCELHGAGINRLSVGFQSFIDEELKWMNRSHSAKQNVECIDDAVNAGISNITVDLIYGSKFQSEKSWEETLRRIERLGVQHLSCYNLTVEDRTVLGNYVSKKKENEIDEELSAKQFEMLINWSRTSGFEQYEISNFSKERFISKHNSAYWLGEKYIGLGPSAHSYDLYSRQWNISNNSVYIRNIESGGNFFEREELDEKTKLNEYLLTRLRTKWGINPEHIRKEFSNYAHRIDTAIHKETAAGNLIHGDKCIILSERGKLIADHVIESLLVTEL